MAKKIVELSTKKKVELKEMSIDEVDYCSDIIKLSQDENGNQIILGMNKSRTAWLRRGIKGGDFNSFKMNKQGFVEDSVIKQLKESEKNELVQLIQDYQRLEE